MALKPSGIVWGGEEWLRGDTVADLDEYLRQRMTPTEPDDQFVHPVCKQCGGDVFSREAKDDGACRTCDRCIGGDDDSKAEGAIHSVCDSEEYWDDDESGECGCPCGKSDEFRLSVGFRHVDVEDEQARSGRIVNWVYVGGMCVRCGVVGMDADWEINYAPTDQLYDLA
ncbi:MAG TPA: hypothetical protein VKE74_15075 [Gemmataceae bacterium]|nr:hypothetical protein [Gemmataceae bacterium]